MSGAVFGIASNVIQRYPRIGRHLLCIDLTAGAGTMADRTGQEYTGSPDILLRMLERAILDARIRLVCGRLSAEQRTEAERNCRCCGLRTSASTPAG
jgi:hypothetical protein